jgi:hypothetical protein
MAAGENSQTKKNLEIASKYNWLGGKSLPSGRQKISSYPQKY